MSPFNWFTRGNSDRQTESEPTSKEDTPSPEDKGTDEPPQTSTPAPTVSEDYLSWAKAAYQNIQKQKGASAAPVESSLSPPESEAPPEDSGPSTVGLVEAVEEEEVPLSVGTEEKISGTEEKISEEAAEAVSDAVSEVADDSDIATEASPSPTPPQETRTAADSQSEPSSDPSSNEGPAVEASEPALAADTSASGSLPFWAKAEAERLERLERLKETAIEEPEPEPEPATAGGQDTSAGVEFDENFIWSAGVLAAQGRRPEDISVEEITWLKRLRQGLGKTRRSLINQLRGIVGQGPLNQDAVMEIEALLLQADVGIEATDSVIEALQAKLRQDALPPEEAIAYLKQILRDMLDQPYEDEYEQAFAPEKDTLNIWLMTGVNGAGKTTTIGKLAHLARKSDYRCLIAAADTFRAAAVEQVKIWGQRSEVEVIANPGQNTDPAAVVFDAIAAAHSRNTELLLIDTAGRLQNKKNLMDELSKIRRIVDKKAPEAKVESLLVLDATLGQNGLRQAEVFSEAAKLSGVVLTKLDGTAKGGVAIAVVKQLGLPIRFIGAGEGLEDLRPFSSYEFVEALLSG